MQARGKEFGVRAAKRIVDPVYCVAAWLREEHRIPSGAARPPKQSRKKLKEEWAQPTGMRRIRPNRPRNTAAEYRCIFAAMTDVRVNPRIRLAIELAAACGTGQALRCTRTMLTLTEIDSSAYALTPPGQLGQIIIPGAGKKHGETVVLTSEQRCAVDDALRDYRERRGGLARRRDHRLLRSQTISCSPARACACWTRPAGAGLAGSARVLSR